MSELDLGKRDMTVAYGDRTFARRAYREHGAWHGLVIENKTPLPNALPATADAAICFAATVHFVADAVDAGCVPIPERPQPSGRRGVPRPW